MINNNYHPNDSITVSELNQCVGKIIEKNTEDLWVHGEISSLKTPSSGHWYFSLKDDRAVVACAMFQRANINVNLN